MQGGGQCKTTVIAITPNWCGLNPTGILLYWSSRNLVKNRDKGFTERAIDIENDMRAPDNAKGAEWKIVLHS